MKQIQKCISIAILLALSLGANGQEWKNLDTDELFEMARDEAFNGNRPTARQMLYHILESSPNYADVRILLGRTYAWDGERSRAKGAFQTVLDQEPENQDALNAMIDVQMWGEEYEAALATVSIALQQYPTFEDFLYKKASILNDLQQYEEAISTLNQLLLINRASQRAHDLRLAIEVAQQRYAVTLQTGVDVFSRTYDPAFYSALAISRSNSWGSSIARFNFARRFQTTGIQGEVDLYPKIARGVYGYLNYGFSQSDLFPIHRVGAEVFTKLPKSFEGSVGLRHLIFSQDNQITIYTGSLGWYHKSMWFSLRPFITPDARAGTSVSLGLTTRRYFSNPLNYIGLSGGVGYSPDIRTIQSGQGFTTEEIFTLKAQRFGISGQHTIKNNLSGSLNFDFVHQELSFDLDNYVWITSVVGTLSYRF